MATKNGNELQQAMALLIQNQAQFLSHLAEIHKRQDKHQAESDRRFARIEDELEQIKAILLRHDRVLADLPEAIRQKVGFKPAVSPG